MRATPLPWMLIALLATGVALAAPPGANTHFRWTDATGTVHFSDTIPPEALANGYDVVDRQGQLVQRVPRVLTPEERQAAEAEARRQAAARRVVLQQNFSDQQLLASYPGERELAAAQAAQLRQVEAELATLTGNLRSQEGSLADLLAHAADLEHAGKPLPNYLHTRINRQTESVNAERETLVQRKADLDALRKDLAAQTQRFRALRGKSGPSGHPAASPSTGSSGGR